MICDLTERPGSVSESLAPAYTRDMNDSANQKTSNSVDKGMGEKADLGARDAARRYSNGTALLVIDLQKDVLSAPGTWDAEGVVARTGNVIGKARAAGVPVIWVQDCDDMPIGSPGWQLAEGLTPAAADPRINKKYGDSFEETDLVRVLEERGVHHLVVCGAQSDACIRATLHGALVRGYDVTLVSDAHTTGEHPAEFSGGESISARTKINFTNMYVQWGTEYPGRTGATATAAVVEF